MPVESIAFSWSAGRALTTETMIIIISAAGVIITSAGVMVSLVTIAIRAGEVRDQLWLTMFSEYAKRYSEIMARLPFDARRPGSGFDARQLAAPTKERYLKCIRDYIALCSEEFWLNEKGYIDAETWRIWTTGMEAVARFPSFGFAWQTLRPEWKDYFEQFCCFFDEIVASSPEQPVR